MRTVRAALRAVTAAIALAAVPSADAGEYTVDACQTPSGERVLSTGGWQPQSDLAGHACDAPGAQHPGLFAGWNTTGVHMEFRGWTFASPPGTSIVGAALQRHGHLDDVRGRLLGRPGRRAVTVVIYAVGRRVRGQRARVPVEAVRTDGRGRFRYRYRFHEIAGPFHYRFQARTRPDRGYPYAPGRSPIEHVLARP